MMSRAVSVGAFFTAMVRGTTSRSPLAPRLT